MNWLSDPTVSIWSVDPPQYPSSPPFNPAVAYPEYPYPAEISTRPNAAYEAVRGALAGLQLDAEHLGTRSWNPLKGVVREGDTVLLKPNWIRAPVPGEPSEDCIITSGAVIRAVLDYVSIALHGSGSIVLADGPQTDSDYHGIRRASGLDALEEFARAKGINLTVLDLRRDLWLMTNEVVHTRKTLPGDPAGYATIDLGSRSAFADYSLSGRFFGADYNVDEVHDFHSGGRHAYVLCRSALDADAVINIPKLKTHKKVGATLSLKAMVGINGYRNCLPHHTSGTVSEDGDEFADDRVQERLQSRLVIAYKKTLHRLGGTGGPFARTAKTIGRVIFGRTDQVVRSGNWYGNDTAWRMVLDLNRCLFYFQGTGEARQEPLRYLTVVDGIIGGQGNGPMLPTPVQTGLVLAGFNPVAVDTVGAVIMGFDPAKLRMISSAWDDKHAFPLVSFRQSDINVRSNTAEWVGGLEKLASAPRFAFEPHFGWKGHIELDRSNAQSAISTALDLAN